ncbi:tRNA pseudouridine synthase A [Haloferula helveola]|uniref:tRNA pseudouridine synthase A n=1 Tax=Haloferula helveola TaxID=490095 RepID=A0ABN6H2D3_9BACT|nr:tRNA pseudouridine synthase A [Haloferula helveola]
MRIKLTLAYDGRPHDGWQSQPGGNTVQDLLESAASETAKQPVRVHGSGRTDAGVHALAQVAHLDAPDGLTMNPFNWVPALNTKLPASIRVLSAEEVGPEFHARFSATSKTYRYEISTEPVLSPFRAGLAWHLPRQYDPYLLEDALKLTLGRHDFEAFAAKRGNETEDTDHHRTLTRAELDAFDHGWRLTWSGDGFLYKMVRLLTGSVVRVAQGRLRLDEFAAFLDQPEGLPHGRSSHCAPADGLYLESVSYDPSKGK